MQKSSGKISVEKQYLTAVFVCDHPYHVEKLEHPSEVVENDGDGLSCLDRAVVRDGGPPVVPFLQAHAEPGQAERVSMTTISPKKNKVLNHFL